ncbi:helix-turn-helix domain-containing protein [Microbulbifer sp. ZKSA006]|uniref:helix-turn-helix domain-containing protein n=1 Tax=Microbulbifer sp. ZKSA006 TaxID=3243390 RepID=UPI004039B620
MQLAKQLLMTTSLSTAEISDKCGYESESAFRKAFKKQLDINPGSVRKSRKL